MAKKTESSEPAQQISAEDAKNFQANKKLLDQVFFRVSESGKTTFSKKPFDKAD